MKKFVRLLALTLCALCLLAVSAEASDMVRMTQIRLADLGYYAGRDDGILGPATKSAIKSFQRQNGLPANGKLTTETYDMLASIHDQRMPGRPVRYKSAHAAPEEQTIPDDPWRFVETQTIPVRFGELKIDEEARDTVHRFTIMLNGRAFLRADNQPNSLRISKVFQLEGEDAVIMTAWRGEPNCMYKNYLITVHANGSSPFTREFTSCSPANEVHEAFNALFVRFSSAMSKDGWASWDVWRYENSKLERL
jgi:hypothetical protein